MENIGRKKLSEVEDSPEVRLGRDVVRVQMAIRTSEVDKDRTIELVMLAKGARSMRQFAEDLGVNVSSISRIVNGKVTEIRAPLLAGIACKADPGSGVTIEKLMEAQGLTDPESREMAASRYELECRRIIVDELLKRGYSVEYSGDVTSGERDYSMVSDFVLVTDALGAGAQKWMFECKMMSVYSALPIGVGRSQMWLNSVMSFYYQGGKAGRISLVVDHRQAFEHLKARMEQYQISDEISIILISVQRGEVLDEYVAPLLGGKIPQMVFGMPTKSNG